MPRSARAEYKFMPTCNYEIDYFTVTKDGTLLFDDRADSEEVEQRAGSQLADRGLVECEPQDWRVSMPFTGGNQRKRPEASRTLRHRRRTCGAYGGNPAR